MKSKLRRLQAWLPMVAIALSLAACGDQSGGPEGLLGPAQEAPEYSKSLSADLGKLVRGEMPELPGGFVEETIGPRGGFLYIDLHYLWVPRNAVRQPTVFRMEVLEPGQVGVKLTARTPGTEPGTNDVGESGLRRPVYLTFSYRFADLQDDPRKLRVVWLRDGVMDVMPTTVNPWSQTATGTLKHFSQYALAFP